MKVFGIGLNKTGTTSLAKALRILGYKVGQFPLDPEVVEKTINYSKYVVNDFHLDILNKLDGMLDIPACMMYSQLDKCYPNSKFILTVRDKKNWIESCESWFEERKLVYAKTEVGKLITPTLQNMTVALYGSDFDKKKWDKFYNKYISEVFNYFKNRPDDLLVLDIEDTDENKWKLLCWFLGKPLIERKFPWRNKKNEGLRHRFK